MRNRDFELHFSLTRPANPPVCVNFQDLPRYENRRQQIKVFVITEQANSLYPIIADEQYCATSLSCDTWKSLIEAESSLQINCNKEGFNVLAERACVTKALVSLVTITTSEPATPESGLVREDIPMTPTCVETRLKWEEIMTTSTSKPRIYFGTASVGTLNNQAHNKYGLKNGNRETLLL